MIPNTSEKNLLILDALKYPLRLRDLVKVIALKKTDVNLYLTRLRKLGLVRRSKTRPYIYVRTVKGLEALYFKKVMTGVEEVLTHV